MQQQIDQVRVQLGQTLDNNRQLIQQQLGQILGHVNERLKDNVEILQRTQQSLGERLDHAATVVGNVQKSLGGFEEAVIPVSPSSFYAYLQAIVLGLKGPTVEERTKEIVQYLSRLRGDFTKFQDDFGLLDKHLGHAQSTQSTEKRLEHFGRRLFAVDGDPELVEYPSYDRKTG